MPRGSQVIRQWNLLQRLQTSLNGVRISDFADEMEVSERSVYRDLEVLQAAGFPLVNDDFAGERRWCLYESRRRSGPLPVDLDEMMALLVYASSIPV